MKRRILTLSISLAVLTGAAVAQAEVTNEAVKARLADMGVIRSNFATIGGMAQGRAPFDAAAAEAAKAAAIEAALMVPEVFEPEESDPESKAKPEIWSNWDDFVAKSEALVTALEGVDTASLDGLKASVGPVGAACGACHQAYRN